MRKASGLINAGTVILKQSVKGVINQIRGSIVVSIPACHVGDRGSIPRHGVFLVCKPF